MIYIFNGNKEPVIQKEWDPRGLPGYCYVLGKNGWFRRNGGQLQKLKWGDREVPPVYRAYALLLGRTINLVDPA